MLQLKLGDQNYNLIIKIWLFDDKTTLNRLKNI